MNRPELRQLMVVGLVRQMNRVAWERDRDIGHQVQVGDRCRQRQRREHIVRPLEGGDATGTGIAKLPCALSRVGQAI